MSNNIGLPNLSRVMNDPKKYDPDENLRRMLKTSPKRLASMKKNAQKKPKADEDEPPSRKTPPEDEGGSRK